MTDAELVISASPFDVHRWSDYPEVNALVDRLTSEVINCRRQKRIRVREPLKVKRSIKVLVLDLWAAASLSTNPYRGISLNKGDYQSTSRYKKIHLKFDYVRKALEDLEELGYVERKRGFFDPAKQRGRRTRIKATDKLVEHIYGDLEGVSGLVDRVGEVEIFSEDLVEHSAEVVILRNERKENIEYEDTDLTNGMRERILQINQRLARTKISLRITDDQHEELLAQLAASADEEHGSLDFTRKRLYRVFNDGSFEKGGRFYGGWWQGVPSRYRRYIEIDHGSTCEVDYSGHHYRILYAKKGLNSPDDPYDIEGIPRDVQKQVGLVMLNSATRQSAVKALAKTGIRDAGDLYDRFLGRHEAIADSFGTDAGKHLQFIDSQVAELVMLRMMDLGGVALPVHDSFIVRMGRQNELEQMMQQAYQDLLGGDARLAVKPTFRDGGAQREAVTTSLELDSEFVTDDLRQLLQGYSWYHRTFGR